MYKLNKLAAGSVIAAAAALASAGAALADGYVAKGKTVVYERPADWSGVYFGVQSGYSWSSIDQSFPVFGADVSYDFAAPIVGAHIGLQHQFGGVVLGVEGTWLSTLEDNPDIANPCHAGGFYCNHRLSDILSVGGRIGWAAGHWMPYATGGYASARFEYEERDVATNTKFGEQGTRHNGWYVGGGFEWAVSPGWTTGLEYRHYEFDSKWQTPHTPGGSPIGVDINETDASVDTITARVSWRWGRPEAKPLK